MENPNTPTDLDKTFILPTIDGTASILPGFSKAAQTWDGLLTDQVALLADFELDHIKMLPQWRSARRIADIGCGNGAYLARLAEHDPSKIYFGIDPSDELIAFAKARSSIGISFRQGYAPCTQSGQFDLILLRFVVQHVGDPSAFFSDLLPMSHGRTAVVIIEPSFAGSRAQPALQELNALIANYEGACQAEQRSRALVDDQAGLASVIGSGWHIQSSTTVTAQLERATWRKEALRRVLHGWSSMLERFGPAENADGCRREIDAWIDGVGASIEIALKITLLQRESTH